jgi:hypothetical protein
MKSVYHMSIWVYMHSNYRLKNKGQNVRPKMAMISEPTEFLTFFIKNVLCEMGFYKYKAKDKFMINNLLDFSVYKKSMKLS